MSFEQDSKARFTADDGETYLSLNDVLHAYSKNEKTAHIVGPTIITLSISVGALLFVVNYKKNRGK